MPDRFRTNGENKGATQPQEPCYKTVDWYGTWRTRGILAMGRDNPDQQAKREAPLAFRRNPRLMRTPPRSDSLPDLRERPLLPWESPPDVIEISDDSEPTTHRKETNEHKDIEKRKRSEGESPPTDHKRRAQGQAGNHDKGREIQQMKNADGSHEKMTTLTANLRKFCKENSNVHKEIKKMSTEMERLAEECKRAYRESKDTKFDELSKVVRRLKAEHEKEKQEARNREKQSIERIKKLEDVQRLTATNRQGRTLDEEATEDELLANIREAKTTQAYDAVVDKKWKEEWYTMTGITEGNPLATNGVNKLAVIMSRGEWSGASGFARLLKQRFPEVATAIEKVDYRAQQIKVHSMMTVGTNIHESCTTIYCVALPEEERSVSNVAAALQELKVLIGTQGSEKEVISLPNIEGVPSQNLRKLAELILGEAGIKTRIHIPRAGKQAHRTTGAAGSQTADKRQRTTEAILVKQEGQTYAGLLKAVKERVSPSTKAAEAIKTIRKSKDGHLVMVVDGKDKDLVAKLRQDLAEVEGSKVTVVGAGRNRNVTLYIKEIDGITSAEEVEAALLEEITDPSDRAEIKIGKLRPFYGGNQAVTIVLGSKPARALIRKGYIRIRLNQCKVVERLEVTRCFKCLGYGHKRDKCNAEEDFTNACIRCGKQGHKAVDCKEVKYCLNCRAHRHTSGSGKCPDFRAAVRKDMFYLIYPSEFFISSEKMRTVPTAEEWILPRMPSSPAQERPDKLISEMCENKTKWEIGHDYLTTIMRTKEQDERRLQGEAR
ncbi:hypothetical protein NQ315_015138 [Exocentrus adspersus]|uniref:CCHC-type domain-containing protein n=1 Tax=Exocentrus adspersus TaxID=1586481 RepID=A0AAV8VFJ1_9CUCU|nr:hypothetical protein NQ315_015138 [Exocentrus adspersus]